MDVDYAVDQSASTSTPLLKPEDEIVEVDIASEGEIVPDSTGERFVDEEPDVLEEPDGGKADNVPKAAPIPHVSVVGIAEAPDWPSDDAFLKTDLGKTGFRRLFYWGPIISIILTVCIGICTIIVLAEMAPPFDTVWNFLNLMFHLLTHYMMFTNFIKAAIYGPGYVKEGWRPADESVLESLQFCAVCEGFKAPRSHHCSLCNRCVMKMEHHCPWINNCVGHRNHAFFCKFMFFAVLGCLHAVYVSMGIVVKTFYILLFSADLRSEFPIQSLYTLMAAITAACLASGVMIAVGMLLFYQVFTVIRNNKTAVEEYICLKSTVRFRDDVFIYPYDLGWKRNFADVLWNGDFPKGNGVWWPIRADCTQFTFSEEQLKQKILKAKCARLRTVMADYDGTIFCGAMKAGFKVFVCQPCTDGRRMAVKEGEKIATTRGQKGWIYGKVVEARKYHDKHGNVRQEYFGVEHWRRGWFPSMCLLEKKDQAIPIKQENVVPNVYWI